MIIMPRHEAEEQQTRNDRNDGYKRIEEENVTIQATTTTVPEEDIIHIEFPPLFVLPAIWQWLLAILVIAAIALFCTVGKSILDDGLHLTPRRLIEFATIPVISLAFTYVHIWAALWLTFYPIRFFGCCQIPKTNVGLGWQGIVPNRAKEMAQMSVKLMTTQLLDVREVFGRLDPSEVSEHLLPLFRQTLENAVDKVAIAHNPSLWRVVPQRLKNEVLEHAVVDSKRVIASLMSEIQVHIDDLLDLEGAVVSSLLQNPELLCQMFIACGYRELSFIRASGAYFGVIFGVIQMVIFFFYRPIWLLPVMGTVIGALTNAIALWLIFKPIDPIHLRFGCGTVVWQGLFLKRQHEVSEAYAQLVSKYVLTGPMLMRALVSGSASDRLYDVVYRHICNAADATFSPTPSLQNDRNDDSFDVRAFGGVQALLNLVSGTPVYQSVRNELVEALAESMPSLLYALGDFAENRLQLRSILRDKLRELSPKQFERLLHPVFESDEWKLILMGGVLGGIIGTIQAYAIGS